MRVFVTGLSGMLGHSLAAALPAAGHSVAGCGTRPAQSLSLPGSVTYRAWRFGQWSDLQELQQLVRESRADVLLHAAAYTRVDLAEQEEAAAHLINGLYTQAAARVAEELSIDLVYVSTDYVFDGRAGKPYREWDDAAPLGVYGRSKLEGEVAARRIPRHHVVRTSWLFGEHGPNFVTTILKAARERPELRVVDDQFGSPTYTGDLAAAITHLIETRRYGVHHLTNSGVTTWCDFAREVVVQAGLSTPIHPQSTAEAGRPAPRPAFGALENWAWHLAGEKPLPPWQDALGRYLVSIGELPVAHLVPRSQQELARTVPGGEQTAADRTLDRFQVDQSLKARPQDPDRGVLGVRKGRGPAEERLRSKRPASRRPEGDGPRT